MASRALEDGGDLPAARKGRLRGAALGLPAALELHALTA